MCGPVTGVPVKGAVRGGIHEGHSGVVSEVDNGAGGEISDSKGQKYSVWTLSAPVRAMQYINGMR